MKPFGLMIGVLTGAVLIVLGLAPGWFQQLTEGVRNLLDSISTGAPVSAYRGAECESRRPVWLAVIGAAWIAFCALAYLSS